MAKKNLVVDGESSIREALIKMLCSEHYEVATCKSGPTAIEKFRDEKIDLMLLDPGLTAADSWGGLTWLAQVNPILPLILITARSKQRELAEKAGADALMEKPLDMPHLLRTIRELIDEPVERRICRAYERVSTLRFVPCDQVPYREMLTERFATPNPCPEYDSALE